jgi:hypothetical protein
MNAIRRLALVLSLLALLAVPGAAVAQTQPEPDPSTPETLPQEQEPGDDDEELGEEIPEQEPDEPEGGSGGSGGGPPPADPPARATPRDELPRTGRDPMPVLATGVVLLVCGIVLRQRAVRT